MNQKQVDRVANAVLALRPAEERSVEDIPRDWTEGDVLFNTRTGESFYLRYIDRDRDVVGIDPPLLHG